LSPGGEFIPWGELCPLGVKLYPGGEILCSLLHSVESVHPGVTHRRSMYPLPHELMLNPEVTYDKKNIDFMYNVQVLENNHNFNN
jgi:hypothetical protein